MGNSNSIAPRMRLIAAAGSLLTGMLVLGTVTPAFATELSTDSSASSSAEASTTDTASSDIVTEPVSTEQTPAAAAVETAPVMSEGNTQTDVETEIETAPDTSQVPTATLKPVKTETVDVAPEASITPAEAATSTYPSTPACINVRTEARVVNGSVNWSTGTLIGDLVSSKAGPGTKLCDAVATRSTGWPYAAIEQVWPQGLPKALPRFTDFTIDALGPFTLQIPGWTNSCEQGDFYAQLVSKGGYDALKLPDTLYANHQPFEPPFLHQVLKGLGFNAYHQTTAKGCNLPQPVTVTGYATFETLSCLEGSKNNAIAPAVSGGQWTISAEGVDSIVLPLGEGYDGGVPDGFPYGDITFSLSDGASDDLFDVLPWSGVWQTVDPDALECVGPPSPVVVTGTISSEVQSCVVGTRNWVHVDAVEDSITTFTDSLGNEAIVPTVNGYDGGLPAGLTYGEITIRLSDAGADDTIEVSAVDATWTPVNPESLGCTPPTTTTTDTKHTPPTAPKLPATLAATGAESFAGLSVAASLLLLIGLIAVISGRRKVAQSAV